MDKIDQQLPPDRITQIESRLNAIEGILANIESDLRELHSRNKRKGKTPPRNKSERISDKCLSKEEILEIRTRLNLTQAEAAQRVGTSLSSWQDWEYGRYSPSRAAARAIQALRDGKI
ncbi:hypothetical protein A3D88_00945 [Candidatus Peribacteria bacterium RIFCSPHIGHO2_02_FULL_52_16]|nr:MAG: hypothetical protein A2706_05590 [Candidatus Peribacteria bacterium RIFCSPHIGHO2_01_FULL_51_35]OGJ61233.1 MAG: hypothetical protein A3D88_00945 [Candidatus Peribacteria bacterium RIFCSPHIGHO2_02_FULL_52_16]